jgi:hypothetical protein
MSCIAILPPSSSLEPFPGARKRTHSFSMPKTTKSARTLQRTASFITLSDALEDDNSGSEFTFPSVQSATTTDCSPFVAPSRSLRAYKESRQKRHLGAFTAEPTSYTTPPQPSPTSTRKLQPQSPLPHSPFRHRTSSPLAPTPKLLPPRPTFPRSRPDLDANLHRRAIVAQMRCSPEGHKILTMGARIAVSMLTATRELEAIIAAQERVEREGRDVPMADAWTAAHPEAEWEMVDS